MIKKISLIATVLMLSLTTYAQFGITGGYQKNLSTEWNDALKEQRGLGISGNNITNGWAFGVDYWFRLKNKRIEFLPELRASRTDFSFETSRGQEQLDINNYAFNFNVHIYPFDFDGDCDCPTWSKEGPSFSKGFFIRLSPSIGYWQVEENFVDAVQSNSDLHTNIGAGAGLDIGLSDLVTITPLVEYRWHSAEVIEGLNEQEINYQNWFAGIRLGVRLDD